MAEHTYYNSPSLTPTTTARIFRQIVPSDTTEYDFDLKALYCQADGDVRLEDWAGSQTVFTLVAGQILYVRPKRVLVTGTTATIVGLWT